MSAEDPSQFSSLPTGLERTSGGNVQWKPPTVEHLQALLPQYEIVSLLGHGGMGAVYKARQITLDHLVAIKILPPEAADDGDANFVERFKNEARTMARMNHPAIVHVHDFGETAEGQLYFIMEFVDGTDVSQMVRGSGRLPPEHALAITAHVCDALDYAHSHGVIHRDIKPANVLINQDGQVKVADFGLAKASDPSQMGLTKSNMAMGTPDFVAPEALISGVLVDERADLYAVGVMLYNMLTGEIPRGMFQMPSQKLNGGDTRFDAIIARAMQTDREHRYQSAMEIRSDLDAIITTPLVQAADESDVALAQSDASVPSVDSSAFVPATPARKPWLIPAVLAGVAVLGAGGWMATKPKAEGETKVVQSVSSPPKVASITGADLASKPAPEAPTKAPDEVAPAAAPKMVAAASTPKMTLAVPEPKPGPAPSPEPVMKPVVQAAPASSPVVAVVAKEAAPSVPTPPPPPIPAELASLDQMFLKLQAERVTGPFDTDVGKLNTGYLGGLDGAMTTQKAAKEFSTVLALEAEKKRFAEKHEVPTVEEEADPDAKTPEALKKLFAIYREAYAKLEAKRAANLKLITDPLNVKLQDLETDFTKNAKLTEAKVVHEYRESLAESLTETASAEPAAQTGGAPKPKTVAPMIGALKDGFTNSLGMKFMHVNGTKVLFCIHHVRRMDYAAYAKEVPVDPSWRTKEREGVPVGQEDDHPVVAVNWGEANAFCEWLSRKEGHTYRLPTDREWSYAVGVASLEKVTKSSTPESMSEKVPNMCPWGNTLMPPPGAANVADITYKAKFPASQFITGYQDGYATTSPVMKFKAGKFGLYDMAGNVNQMCEDWFNATKTAHVIRGSCWSDHQTNVLSSHRGKIAPEMRNDLTGFRIVVLSGAP